MSNFLILCQQSTGTRMFNTQYSLQFFFFFFSYFGIESREQLYALWMDFQLLLFFFNDHVKSPLDTIDLIFFFCFWFFIDKTAVCLFYEHSFVCSFKNPFSSWASIQHLIQTRNAKKTRNKYSIFSQTLFMGPFSFRQFSAISNFTYLLKWEEKY